MVQRLIHVHEVNDLYAGLKDLPKKQHAAAAREFLTRRVAEELTALLGTDYKDGTYVGKSVAIKAWVAEVEGWIAGDATTWSAETIELMRQDINRQRVHVHQQGAPGPRRQARQEDQGSTTSATARLPSGWYGRRTRWTTTWRPDRAAERPTAARHTEGEQRKSTGRPRREGMGT